MQGPARDKVATRSFINILLKAGYTKPASLADESYCYSPAHTKIGPGFSHANAWVTSLPQAVYYCAREYTTLILPKSREQVFENLCDETFLGNLLRRHLSGRIRPRGGDRGG